jgi:hypothetical protein
MRMTSARMAWALGLLLVTSLIGCAQGQMLTDPSAIHGIGQTRDGGPVRS